MKHEQSQQRASALTGSINIFHSTTIKVYEVENQKTINKKLGKQTTWFSEATKDFHHYFQEKRLEDTKRQKIGLGCIPKTY